MRFSEAPEAAEAAKLCIVKSYKSRYKCAGCVSQYGVDLKEIEVRFQWSRKECSDETNLLESFLQYILGAVSDLWGADVVQFADIEPLATICVAIPVANMHQGCNTRGLLRRSYSTVYNKQDLSTLFYQPGFEIYDILTEEHFQDIVDIVDKLTASDRANVKFVFKTEHICPTICYRHNHRLRRKMHNLKRKGIQLFRRFKNKILSNHLLFRKENFRLPELTSLVRSGLYSPRYIDQEINEIHSSVTESIIKGFQTLKL